MKLETIISTTKATAAEAKTIAAARARLSELDTLAVDFRSPDSAITAGQDCTILDQLTAAAEAFLAAPSAATMETYISAERRAEFLRSKAATLSDLFQRAAVRIRSELAPVAGAIVDRIAAELDKQATDGAEHAAKAGLAGEHAAKVAACRAELDEHRAEASRDPLAWLLANVG